MKIRPSPSPRPPRGPLAAARRAQSEQLLAAHIDAAEPHAALASKVDVSATYQQVRKDANESRVTSTVADDGILVLDLDPGTRYHIRGRVLYEAPVSSGIQLGLGGPTGTTLVAIERSDLAGGPDVVDRAFGLVTSQKGAVVNGSWRFDAIIATGAEGGTFAVRWAQAQTDAEATVLLAGSALEWRAW